ncbi:hypothetical protein [Allokutzneria sp. NRRL B-24872]|uniref:hypothetical protein n=1 Tax=Allokutzneria sp. NRRL B-24872 TaxID=1137961 RepID=UPI000A39B388|nr:hypothetical protein [Allokutzneria sp. NRRL B-24872]
MTQPEYGATPWGRAWVRAVESTAVTRPNPLLPRARSLVRNNAVTELRAETGSVTATVSGHTVHIGLPLWTDVPEGLVADHTGDLPDELADTLAVAVPLAEQHTECDCRTRNPHCAHVLAALYALSQRVDERPVLAATLRYPLTEPTDPDWIPLAEIDVAGFYGG